MIFIIVLLSVFLVANGKNEEYTGYKVYNINLETEAQAARIDILKGELIDFWRNPSLKHDVVGRAMVPASQMDWFEMRLRELNITKDIFTEDVYDYLSEVEKSLSRTRRIYDDDLDNENENNIDNDDQEEDGNDEDATEEPQIVFDFNAYYRYDDILAYIEALTEVSANSSVEITVEEFGRTVSDRPLVYIRLSPVNNQNISRPIVIVEAGIIPREWITIPAALNIVNRILEDNSYLDSADWIIVPVVNPDGYEYTHTNLRLWTKNLSTNSNLGFICPGVNINRNFDIDWQGSGASSSPCSHLYAGVEPFSEVESQMIKHLVDTYDNRIRLYVSIQNTGAFISYPWQYERAASGMFRQHLFLGLEMVNATNNEYVLDVGWSALGDRAAGTGSDYAQDNGVLYSLNVGIVERGDDGVNVPEDEIVDVIEDVWRAVSVAATTIL